MIDVLSARQPKFFFTSHFERMSGMVSIEKLQQDKQNNTVSVGDKIFLDVPGGNCTGDRANAF